MRIQHNNDGHKGSFSAMEENSEVGFITYSLAGDTKMILDHTEIDEAYRGQSVGKKIVFAIVDYAREHHISIIPLCPFAKSVFIKNESIQDVLSH